MIELDAAKDRANIAKHGISLRIAPLLFAGRTVEREDTRQEYGERRIIAYGLIEDRVYVCVYTLRGNTRRVISLRKANGREIHAYYQSLA